MAHGPMIPGRGTGDSNVRVRKFPWWILTIIGVICVISAIGLVAFPWAPVNLLSIIIGVGFIASGLSTFVAGRGWAGLVAGAALTLAGILAIVFSDLVSDVIVTMLGVGLIFAGALWLLLAIRSGGIGFLLIPALVTLAAGVVTLIWPTFTLTIVAMIVGFMLLITGIFFIVQGMAARKIPPTIIQE